MSRYTYTNLNWRDGTNRWEWSAAYTGWLALAEIHKREERCKPARSAVIETAFPLK